ncbi:MAG TPA: hypothetical protein VIV40_32100 [Kofleriaceae bacterium]
MNIKAFFVEALTSALDLKIGTPADVLRHVTPDVLALHLPRPLWARLLTACLGAPRVDPQLVVETIGIANLCEHIPAAMIWGCIAEFGARALGKEPDVATPNVSLAKTPSGRNILAPPPDVNNAPTATGAPVAIGPNVPTPPPTAAVNQPLADVITELENDDRSARPRSPTAQRFRQSNTGVARGLSNSRRPQAVAPPTTLPRPTGRRGGTEVSAEPEPPTSVDTGEWGAKEIAVDDSQLVEWQADVGPGSAITGDEDFSDLGRKR